MTENENTLKLLANAVVHAVEKHQNGMKLTGFLWDVTSGPDKGQTMLAFKPKGYENMDIRMAYFRAADIIAALDKASLSGEAAYAETASGIRNEIAVNLLSSYIPLVKEQIASSAPAEENQDVKHYHDELDKSLVTFVELFFRKALGMEMKETGSIRLADYAFRIIAETNEGVYLKLLLCYSPEIDFAQLQLEMISVPKHLRGMGISKTIINNLLTYCSEMGKTQFLLVDVVNEDWENYLLQKGASIVEKGGQHGDVLTLSEFL